MIRRENDYLKVHSKLKYLTFLFLYFLLYLVAKLIFGRKNNWLFCERGFDAQDNAFVFFKYMVNNHPEYHCTFIIDKNSSDFEKVSAIGKTVQFSSFKHLLMTIGCPVKISSHLFGYSPWTNLTLYYRRNKTVDKHIFLQHGITKNYHAGLCKNCCCGLDLFICGAKPEYEYIFEKFGYDNSVPQYTGFPRYDLLNNNDLKNQILIMPTWRSNLVSLPDEQFVRTKFYLLWKEVIENPKLITIAKDAGLTIKFYLHSSFQKFAHLFEGSNYVEIVKYIDENVQSLLITSRLLITDYSSVYFDFAYLNKPIVYYQFDEDDYYSNHYEKGYFDYRKDGFGDVCTNINALVSSINDVIKQNYIVDDKYKKRIQRFFEYRDSNNCERVYDSIRRLTNGKR